MRKQYGKLQAFFTRFENRFIVPIIKIKSIFFSWNFSFFSQFPPFFSNILYNMVKNKLINNSNIKYSTIRFYKFIILYTNIEKMKKILYDRWKINNCWRCMLRKFPVFTSKGFVSNCFPTGEPSLTLLGFNPSYACPSGRYPRQPPSPR